jgi:AraC-like DNA-binding protein
MSIHVEQIRSNDRQSFRLLRWRDNLQDVEQCDGDGQVSPVKGAGERWHLHREMELAYIEGGRGLRVVGDHIAPFHGPELVLLGPHLPHCWHGLRKSTGFALQFHWPLDHPLRGVPEFAALRALWQRAGRGLLFPAEVCGTVQGYFHELIRASTPTRLGLLLAILGELSAVPPAQFSELSRLEFGVRDGSPHQQGIEKVIRRVLERYEEPHSMAEVLKLAGMTKPTFARQFPRYTGCTFTEFLARVRLDHARQRILAGQESISTAAFAVGFNHLSHFNRFYLRAFGRTPTQDRAGSL